MSTCCLQNILCKMCHPVPGVLHEALRRVCAGRTPRYQGLESAVDGTIYAIGDTRAMKTVSACILVHLVEVPVKIPVTPQMLSHVVPHLPVLALSPRSNERSDSPGRFVSSVLNMLADARLAVNRYIWILHRRAWSRSRPSLHALGRASGYASC